jgi:hypothetical protein
VGDRTDMLFTHVDGPAPEMAVSRDIVRRGVIVAPVLIALGFVIWGADGAWSAAYGIVIVLANFALAAALVTFTARISIGVMMGAVLFGYLARLGLIFAAVWFVQDAAWISFPAIGATIIITHLGLLMWEMKHVSLSLAHPGLKPTAPISTTPTSITPGSSTQPASNPTSPSPTTLTHD